MEFMKHGESIVRPNITGLNGMDPNNNSMLDMFCGNAASDKFIEYLENELLCYHLLHNLSTSTDSLHLVRVLVCLA